MGFSQEFARNGAENGRHPVRAERPCQQSVKNGQADIGLGSSGVHTLLDIQRRLSQRSKAGRQVKWRTSQFRILLIQQQFQQNALFISAFCPGFHLLVCVFLFSNIEYLSRRKCDFTLEAYSLLHLSPNKLGCTYMIKAAQVLYLCNVIKPMEWPTNTFTPSV